MLLEKARKSYEKGQKALLHCNLPQAQKCFFEAAVFYYKGKTSGNYLNSAICYYLGADYSTAIQTAGMIDPSRLSKENRTIWEDLCHDAQLRMVRGHKENLHQKLVEYKKQENYMAILSMLKEDPWMFGSDIHASRVLAKQMRDACLQLKMEEVADLFAKDLVNLEKQ